MMIAARHHMRIWALWILGVTLLLMANPWGELGWVEITAAISPIVIFADRRISREPALAIGLPALTLMWLMDPLPSSIVQLLIAWVVFSGGVLLTARTLRRQVELEAIAGLVSFDSVDSATAEQFHLALDRELGRARRHERSFAVLSAAPHPHSLEADASGFFRSELLRALAENRARLELQDFLRAELHVYSDLAIDGPRVLALVPEVEGDALEILLERLKSTADDRFEFDVQIGAACFARDAVCADDLIAVADRHRKTSKLRSLPERISNHATETSGWRSPDVQG